MTLFAGLSLPVAYADSLFLGGPLYEESFDLIGDGLPAGFSVHTDATGSTTGTPFAFVPAQKSWGDSAGAFKNLASTNGVTSDASAELQGASLNRALGIRTTGSYGDPGSAVMVTISNTLGYSGLQLSVDLLMLSVQGRSQTWTIDYRVGDAGDFSVLGIWADPGVWGGVTFVAVLGSDADNQEDPVYIRFVALTASSGSGSRDTVAVDHVKIISTPVIEDPPKSEPSNQASGLDASLITHRTVIVNWTDAVGEVVPDGYLVRGTTGGFDAIPDPVDGINVANATGWAGGFYANKIVQGVHQLEFRGLVANQTYHLKLFPYSNSGTEINYKIDGAVPELEFTTAVAPFEDVEDVSQLSYTTNTIVLKSGAWRFENAMIGWTASDKRRDQKSVRMQGEGSLAMMVDAREVETLSLEHACYGSDTGGRFTVQMSVDGGASWSQTGPEVLCGSEFVTSVFPVHRGMVRFRIFKHSEEGDFSRINIDNIRLTPFVHKPSLFLFQ